SARRPHRRTDPIASCRGYPATGGEERRRDWRPSCSRLPPLSSSTDPSFDLIALQPDQRPLRPAVPRSRLQISSRGTIAALTAGPREGGQPKEIGPTAPTQRRTLVSSASSM